MNRVLEYSARTRYRRGTAYGNASICMAGLVFVVPLALYTASTVVQAITRNSAWFVPGFRVELFILDAPAVLTICLPVLGLFLGAVALNLRCKRYHFVALGVLVNIAGLIAAICALLTVG